MFLSHISPAPIPTSYLNQCRQRVALLGKGSKVNYGYPMPAYVRRSLQLFSRSPVFFLPAWLRLWCVVSFPVRPVVIPLAPRNIHWGKKIITPTGRQ